LIANSNIQLFIIKKIIKQRNSLEQTIDYITNAFKYYYIDSIQQRINCLEKLFELKLNQIINCLDNSNKTKMQKYRKNPT